MARLRVDSGGLYMLYSEDGQKRKQLFELGNSTQWQCLTHDESIPADNRQFNVLMSHYSRGCEIAVRMERRFKIA